MVADSASSNVRLRFPIYSFYSTLPFAPLRKARASPYRASDKSTGGLSPLTMSWRFVAPRVTVTTCQARELCAVRSLVAS